MPKQTELATPHWKAFSSRRRDPATKREAVLQTAAQLFIEKTYGRTSLNDVADRLNITKPALYHYFRNKEEILLECYRLGVGMIDEILADIAANCTSGLEKVEAFIFAYANIMTVNFGRCVFRLDDAELTADARLEVKDHKRKIDRRLRSFIEEGMRDGTVAACEPKLAAFAIAGALNWIGTWYEPAGSLSAPDIAAEFSRTLTRGLARKQSARDLRNGDSRIRKLLKQE